MTIEQLAQLHIPIPPMLAQAIGYEGQARQRPLPPAEVLVADYLGGLSMHKIAQKYHVNIRRIRPVLVSTGVLGKLRGITFAKTRGLPRKDWAHSQTMSQELTSGEWGYIAGIFDGEGSVKWHLEWHPPTRYATR
jgi:hypothetical protein